MSKYVIDGLFLTQTMTGIQRYAYELTHELDKIISPHAIEILVPKDAEVASDYQNIKLVRYGSFHGILWEQIDFAHYARKNKAECICLTNVLPLLYAHGIVTIHDICYKVNPHFFTSKRDQVSALWHRLNYWRAVHSSMDILTDSIFSRTELEKYYKVASERVTILYCGWQHMERIAAAADTFEKYPELHKGRYYFSMSTLGANKNFKWLLYAAKNNPEVQIAIAGGGKLKGAAEAEGFADLPNIHFLGYVSDADAKTLMANGKAFVFPTMYEGFGLTPLEAVSCGALRIVVSDTPCMHEVYGDNAEYIDQTDYKNAKIAENGKLVSKELLEKYSWKKSAEKLLSLMESRSE